MKALTFFGAFLCAYPPILLTLYMTTRKRMFPVVNNEMLFYNEKVIKFKKTDASYSLFFITCPRSICCTFWQC